ncbi:MAG: ester cyclase [Klebsiella quasipneumoniae]|nr:ester cyclase [Klebsiella quasipneumoniae]
MNCEENIQATCEFYRLIEANEYDKVKDLCHPDFKFYSSINSPLNADEFITQEKGHMDGFPGFKMTVVETFAKEDKVAAYLTFSGVHRLPYLDVQPTHRSLYFSLMVMLTFSEGKVIECRAHYNAQDIMNQLVL